MKKRIALVLISSGIIFASAFGATSAKWAVTDNAEPFGIKVSPYIDRGTKNIYLDTGGSTLWDKDGAWFDAHCWMGVEESADCTMTKVEGTSIYKATINANYQKLVFARVEPGKELDADWTYVWNKTEDLDIPADKEIYTITGWGSETKVCPGQWEASAHTCTAGDVVKENVVEHTCTTDGSYDDVTYCIYCDKELSRTTQVDPAAHDELTHVAKVDETCTTAGNIEHYHCEICDKYYLDEDATNEIIASDTIIPAKGHDHADEWHCDETNHFRICPDCGEPIDVEAHVMGQDATESHGKICSICGLEYTAPLGHTHTMVEHPATAETCTTAGNSLYYQCSGCGKYYSDTAGNYEITENSWVIPALGHDFSNEWSSDSENHFHMCSRCDEVADVEAHTFDFEQKCTVCGYQDNTVNDYLKVWRSGVQVAQYKLTVNPSNSKELMINDVALEKGDCVKAARFNGSTAAEKWTWFGYASVYEHNLTVGISQNTGLADSDGNYVAVENGTYDFIIKFSDETRTNYSGTYINVDDARTLYFQDTKNQGGSPFLIHYWGDDVIGTVWDYKPTAINTGKYDSGHLMYKVVVPSKITKLLFVYKGNQSADLVLENTFGTNNACWLSDWSTVGGYYTFNE